MKILYTNPFYHGWDPSLRRHLRRGLRFVGGDEVWTGRATRDRWVAGDPNVEQIGGN